MGTPPVREVDEGQPRPFPRPRFRRSPVSLLTVALITGRVVDATTDSEEPLGRAGIDQEE